MAAEFEFDDCVIVRRSDRTAASGTAGWHGRIAGKSYENDDSQLAVLAYAVALDEDAGRVWMMEPEDLEPAAG